MAPKSLPILLLTFFSILTLSTAALVGAYRPIEDLNDPYVAEIAKFAVNEHNKQAKTSLVLSKVIGGESQVVQGTNYKLQIKVKGAAPRDVQPQVYEAVVWDKPWEKFRELVSFTRMPKN